MRIKDEREALQKMISGAPDNISENVAEPGKNISELEPEPLMNIDFKSLKEKCEREAKTMIKNAISFMIPMEMIRKNKYLKDKFKVDVMSLAGMIYQLRSNEFMQKALMEQINLGLTHPRYWEVYTGMSKAIGDLNKQLLQTVEAIRTTYKGFKEDVKEKQTEALGSSVNSSGMLTIGDGSVVTRGTKELINRVKEIKNLKVSKNGDDDNPEYLDAEKTIPNIPFDNNNS
jgi:hypothetical protein